VPLHLGREFQELGVQRRPGGLGELGREDGIQEPLDGPRVDVGPRDEQQPGAERRQRLLGDPGSTP
jgi:hypothetical protein